MQVLDCDEVFQVNLRNPSVEILALTPDAFEAEHAQSLTRGDTDKKLDCVMSQVRDLPVFDMAERAKGVDRGALRPKKPSHAALSGEHPLRAIERTSLASPIRDRQPGQRQ